MKKSLVLIASVLGLTGGAWAQQVPVQGTPARSVETCAESSALEKKVGALNAQLMDWPQLGRYREANAALAAPAKDEARVVFLGNSITDGWQNPQFGGFFPGKPYVDRGISGQTTPQMLLRFRADVIALKPRVVVILAGTNDIAGNTGPMTLEEIEGNLTSMAELAKVNGIQVVFSSVLPVCDYIRPQTDRRPPEKILELNRWMKQYAEAN